ncbi:hypothetical protein HGRIS_008988 [Hohenbuehelia grisea]|uniref:Replication factor C subunit 1 n=1 Tax=Hohenbuehelia grisea TaxID=104357 RepID=A0ABR3IZX1_9AGAR
MQVASQSSRKSEVIDLSKDDAGPSKQKATLAKPPPVVSKPGRTSSIRDPSVTPAKTKIAKSHAMDVDEDDEPQPRRVSGVKRKKETVLISSDEDEDVKPSPPKKKAAPSKPRASASSSKAKSKPKRDEDYEMASDADKDQDDDDFIDDDDDELIPKKQPKSKPPAKKPSKTNGTTKPSKNEDAPQEVPAKKPNWYALKAARMAGPSAPGSKEIPEPASEDCLAGLSLVFTGELSSFSRDESIDLAKRFGARVVGQPSGKTDFIILGDNAGPSKLAAIKKHGLKTLNEDEFLNLIATRKGPGNGKGLDEKTKKKKEKEQAAIVQAAKDMEKRESAAGKAVAKDGHKVYDVSTQLWTTRYAPQSLKEICGNKGQVEKLQMWLNDWSTSLKSGFKKPGKNGMNVFRAVLITGPPGIGKTTSAHLCAKLAGFTVIELNASDARSKKLVENGMNINNKSLDGYIAGGQANPFGVTITDRTCLIMDEVDGMSSGDRGGVGALNGLIKKTKVPIICIANDRGAQKLKPLAYTTFSLSFRKPDAAAVRSRILTIAYKEKMKMPANVIDQLITGAQSDIRQVLNMLSTWKLSSDTMNFDESKAITKMNEKYSIMSPFDITQKMLGPYLFSATARETLNEKIELYFHDHSFMPLFIQENYLKTQPAKVRNLSGPEKELQQLRLMEQASASISDGDLVDALIHGPEQHWSLMPLHAVCSAVRPASFVFGNGAGYGGPNAMSFPLWLGQNSKQNKLSRQLADVQIRMRLKVSGDKHEIRQSYIPALYPHIIRPLMDSGTSAVDGVIQCMDDYYLGKEEWDTIVELGVGDNKDELVLKKIATATKTSFTRKYNAGEHPIAFHKAQDLGKAPKKLAAEPLPDIEEAFDVDDVAEEASDDEKPKKPVDEIGSDKLLKVAKKKAAPKATRGKKTD